MKAMLILGGNPERSVTALREVRKIEGFPEVLMIFGTIDNPVECYNESRQAGIANKNICFDFRAWDTVTNFTVILDILLRHKITHLYVVTGKSHLNPRSLWIAKIVCAGHGIKITGFPHPESYKDPAFRTIVDITRTLIWKGTGILTGKYTGILLYNPWIRKRRMSYIKKVLQQTYDMMIKPLLTKI